MKTPWPESPPLFADAGRIGLHVLSDGTNAMNAPVLGLAVATAPRTAWYVPVGQPGAGLLDTGDSGLPLADILETVGPLLSDASIAKTGHDLKAATVLLGRHGVELAGLEFDSMLGELSDRSHAVGAYARGHGARAPGLQGDPRRGSDR